MNPKNIRSEFNYITSQNEDLFERDKFVDAIVNKIVQRSKVNIDCETIGVYGKWGEGKSSVLKLIKNKLDENQEIDKSRFRRVDFTPWYFRDQESLLLDFFDTLKKDFSGRKIRRLINRYSKIVSIGADALIGIKYPFATGFISGIINGIGNIFVETGDVQTLKCKLNRYIGKQALHRVIFIDDVDRLDKDELHALFKLIKQNADFVNMTYVIAMDANIVAKSIATRYEDGNDNAGRNFINKIVQYPYMLPKIQEGHIYKMLFEGLKQKYDEIAKDDKDETKEPDFESILVTILPLFTTPRDVLLYVNSFSFGYNFLHSEICLEDLCYLKVLKMFYPNGYDLIKNSKQQIVAEYTINQHHQSEEDVTKEIYKFIQDVYSGYEGHQKTAIERVVRELLEPMKEKIHNKIELNEKKRLCSPIYFDKYFIYANPEGIISDTQKELFINSLTSISDDDLLSQLEFFFQNYEYNEFTRVIRSILNYRHNHNLDIEVVQKICIALSHLSVNKKRKQYTELNTRIHIEIFMVVILNSYMYELEEGKIGLSRHQDEPKQIETFKKIVESDELLPFHLFFATHFIQEGTAYQNNKKEVDESVFKLLKKYIEQYRIANIFELSEIPIYTLFNVWKESDSKDYHSTLNEHMFSDDFEFVPFLKKMVVRETQDNIFYNHVSYEKFNKFSSLFDADKVYKKIKDMQPEDIDDYDDTIGYFIQGYEQQKSLNNDNMRVKSISNQNSRIK